MCDWSKRPLIYLTASSNRLAMPFLLFEGVTHMALMPQTAGTASFSHIIVPLCFSSTAFEERTEEALLITSLCKLISPNWRVAECDLHFFRILPSVLSPPKHDKSLNPSLIGSATRQPATLCEEINMYTCKHLQWWEWWSTRTNSSQAASEIKNKL